MVDIIDDTEKLSPNLEVLKNTKGPNLLSSPSTSNNINDLSRATDYG